MIISTETHKVLAIERIKEVDLSKGKWEFKLYKKRKKRSLDQNALMWLWLTALEVDSETGYTKEEWKDIFQSEYCPRTMIYVGENKIEKVKSTSQLNTKEFADFLNRIQHFAYHELGISLPTPDDKRYDEFYERYDDLRL